MNENIFLNIIILYSPNYDNKYVSGTVIKTIPLMEQFITFYKSIKINLLNIKYDISIVHWNDFNEDDLNKLNSMDINLIKFDCDKIGPACLARYNVKTRYIGTHRLIAETDMLLLKQPNFNWNVDFQKMYADSCNILPLNEMERIYKIFNIKNKYIKNYNKYQDLFVSYNIKKINKKNLFPHFNNGLTLVKEDFSKKFYKKMMYIDYETHRNLYFDKKYHHIFGQMVIGLVKLELTDNWEPFESGINYLIKSYDIEKFGKDNITLLHYCGTGGGELVKKYFPEYFPK